MKIYARLELTFIILIGLSFFLIRPAISIGNITNILAILLGTFIIIRYKKYKELSKELSFYIKVYTIFLLFLLPSIFTSHSMNWSFYRWLYLYAYKFLPLLYLPLIVTKRNYIYYILGALIISLSLDGLVAVHQAYSLHALRGTGVRSGPVLSLGGMLLLIAPIISFLALHQLAPKSIKIISAISFLPVSAGVIANFSRSIVQLVPLSWMISTASLCFKKQKKKYIMAISIILGCIALYFYNSPEDWKELLSSFNTTTNGSNLGRLYVWQSSIAMFKDHFWFGVGLNDFKYLYYSKYILPAETQLLPNSHNIYLTMASESGLCGVLGLVTLILGIFWSLLKNIYKKSEYDLTLFAIFLTYFCLFGLVETVMYDTEGYATLWYLFGCMLTLKHLENTQIK